MEQRTELATAKVAKRKRSLYQNEKSKGGDEFALPNALISSTAKKIDEHEILYSLEGIDENKTDEPEYNN